MLARPARSNRASNPYNYLLSEQLERLGWTVVDLPDVNTLLFRPDIVHYHWPEAVANLKWPSLFKRACEIMVSTALQKAGGAKIVWTVHNPVSHEQKRPRVERLLMETFIRLVDGVIFLGISTRERALVEYRRLADIPFAIIPHHTYGREYPKPLAELSATIGLRAARIGIVGDLKPYKGIEDFARRFAMDVAGDVELHIWGRFTDSQFRDRMLALVGEARQRGVRITLKEGRLDNQGFVDAIASCDLIALPYANDANSGVAILASELGLPLMTSPSVALRELREEIGHPGSCVIAEDTTTAQIHEKARRSLRLGKRPPASTFVQNRSIETVGRATSNFYEEIITNRSIPIAKFGIANE